MAVKKIPISKLRVGMYITKLDISWIDSPFMYHHLKIKNSGQLDKLIKAGVKQVSIDTSKGDDIANEPEQVSTASTDNAVKSVDGSSKGLSPEPAETLAKESAGVVGQRAAISQELGVAKALKGQVEKLAAEINNSLKNDQAVDTQLVSPLIDGTLSSLQRNNQALATLINIQRKDASLANHTFASFSLALSLSVKLGLSSEEQEVLALAAFFHDTGWLKLPLNLLGKKCAYTPSESKLIQQHIAIGLKSLKNNCDLSQLVMRVIGEHHEYLDGSGYPAGLKANDIHPLSKIFAVVVQYDELVHGLQDRPAITPNGALSRLYQSAKSGRLDENAVSALINLLSVYPVGSAVQLSNKEKGVVLETDNASPKLPTVKVFYDISGMAHAKPKIVNLAKQGSDTALTVASVLDVSLPDVDPAQLLCGEPE